jgi:anti-sigma B factor antagonist
MKMQVQGNTVVIGEIKELGAANANGFRDWVRSSMADGQTNVDVDLSQTTFIDSCGLGALIALQKTARAKQGIVRLIRPQPQVQQILELTRMHRVFDIIKA